GDQVVRDLFYDGNPKAEPGAIVCRVSPSFLRFGNFEILTANEEFPLLKELTDLLIKDHYPELSLDDPDVYGKLLDEIARRTARMITHWMRVGFVHGVMNTDNMSILGLTIDYGPYGWLEPYDPDWTPNTTDAQGRRYCFENQPGIAQWNLARLCEAFLPLIPDEARLHKCLAIYQTTFQESYAPMIAQKLGLSSVDQEDDLKLVQDMFQLLQAYETDYTLFFRALCDGSVEMQGEDFLKLISPSFYSTGPLEETFRLKWIQWSERYSSRISREGKNDKTRSTEMKKINPKYVLRNYLAQNAITATEKGDLSVLERLMRVLKTPYDDLPGEEDLAQKRPEWARNAPGCSALSCSS
ncbi:MAG: protein adenylyltransferase SelO family protein, partial [Bdellovibrionia bacterium]